MLLLFVSYNNTLHVYIFLFFLLCTTVQYYNGIKKILNVTDIFIVTSLQFFLDL